MKPGATAALAIGAGYVLGRQHKLRAALMLGAAAASGRLARRPAPQETPNHNGRVRHRASPRGAVGKVRSAGRSVAVSAFARSADRLGERLTGTADALRSSTSERKET